MSFFLKAYAVIICLLLPIANLFRCDKNNFTYTDVPAAVKEEKDLTDYSFSTNDICVSPDGNDSFCGDEQNPVKSIQRAKELAAEKRYNGINEHINIWIKGGDYYFGNKLEFTSNDAGDVLYVAVPGEKVTFSGAVKVNGWEQGELNGHKCICADIPEGVSHTSVFKNGKTVDATRYPEDGYFYIENEDHSGALYTEENTPWSLTRGDLQLTPSGKQTLKKFSNPDCVTLRVLHLWVDDFSKLTGFDENSNRITFKSPLSASVKKDDRYYFENVLESFDKPGEWYSDNSRIYYIPLEGETPENLDISVASTDRLVTITDCNNIGFEGICFCNTDSKFPVVEQGSWLSNFGLRFPQAEYDCGGALEVTRSNGINVKYCDFINIGIYAVKFNRIVKDSSVTGCNILNTGAGGVFIHGFNEKEDSRITENITVKDNLIDGYGRYFYSAIGVLLTHVRNCDISNNEICNGYYSAVSDGWLWGYSYSVSCNNKICNNLIYNIGQGWLSDMGGIYTLGRQEGTVISGNVIHNVAADPGSGGYGGWGIYLDEGSQLILVEKNLVYDCGSQSFHQHYGENNMIRNNIFALSDEGQAASSFGHGENQTGYADEETHKEFTFERNIFLSDDSAIYVKLRNHTFDDDSNIYWDLTNGKNVFGDYYDDGLKYQRVFARYIADELGLFNNAVFANPGFRDPRNADFTLPDSNPALDKIGFEKWNYNTAGLLTKHK